MSNVQTRVSVPIAEVAFEAYRAVFGRLALLFDLAWLPLIVMLAVALIPGYAHFYLGWRELPVWSEEGMTLRADDVIAALVNLLCLNAFAVRWHQTMLFSEHRSPGPGLFWRAFARFLLYAFLVYLVSAAILTILLVGAASTAGGLALAAAVIASAGWLCLARCSLIFPAAAFGQPLGLAAAWRALSGNFWRLFACGIVACAPVVLIVGLVLSAIFTGFHMERFLPRLPLGFFILRGLVSVCTNIVVVALGASVLSAFYRRIVLHRG